MREFLKYHFGAGNQREKEESEEDRQFCCLVRVGKNQKVIDSDKNRDRFDKRNDDPFDEKDENGQVSGPDEMLLAARQRLVSCMVRRKQSNDCLFRSLDSAKLKVLEGDLSKPRLGLTPEAFHALGLRVDRIVHCGSWVNHVVPFSVLEASNADACTEISRLCKIRCDAGFDAPKVCYVSTNSVVPSNLVGVDGVQGWRRKGRGGLRD